MKLISKFEDGDHIDSQFLVSSVARCVSNNGRPYLNLTLQDSSGTIAGKRWDIEPRDEEILSAGSVVSLAGDVLDYKGTLQFKITAVRELDQSLVDITRFALPCPVKPEILIGKLDNYLGSLKEGPLKRLVTALIADNRESYTTHPAAVKNHHNCLNGLLYHSIRMADLSVQISSLYPKLDRDLLLCGCLVHDIGKIEELSGPITTHYTDEGKLLGHIVIGDAMIAEKAKELGIEKDESVLCLRHMVLSHHGKPEFGSPVRPMTREAYALSVIDDFDAKMDVLDKALYGLEPDSWTQRIYAMDDGYFFKPNIK